MVFFFDIQKEQLLQATLEKLGLNSRSRLLEEWKDLIMEIKG